MLYFHDFFFYCLVFDEQRGGGALNSCRRINGAGSVSSVENGSYGKPRTMPFNWVPGGIDRSNPQLVGENDRGV